MPLLSNFIESAVKAIKRLASTLYPPPAGQEAQTSSSQTSQDEYHLPDTKRRHTNDLSNPSASMAVSDSGEITSLPLPHLPDELWVKIFNFAKPSTTNLLEENTQSTAWTDMPWQNLRGVSKRHLAIYDSMLYPKFLSTFQPATYDDTQYQLLVNEIGEPNHGQVHLSLENGFLKYHLQTLGGISMRGMLNIELNSPLDQQAVLDRRNDIHHLLSKAVQLHEIKVRLIAEMDKLLTHQETILAKNPQSTTLQRHFTCLAKLRHGGMHIFNLLEIEHRLEKINAEIVQARIDDEARSGTSRTLHCMNCRLTRFPQSVLTCPENREFWANVHVLHLNNNQLKNLPAEIGNLVNLKFLFLSYNELHCLPPEMGRLTELVWLHLHHNQLQSLPAEMEELRRLSSLHLEHNLFQVLPDWLNENILCKATYSSEEGFGVEKINKATLLTLQ